MSSNIWTLDDLQSEVKSWNGIGWRAVESQSYIPTMDLVDSVDEQYKLEQEIEPTKPEIPVECQGLDFLYFSPFRYYPYPNNSRFRRKNSEKGVWYSSEDSITAIHEIVFHHLLTFAKSPDMEFPDVMRNFTLVAADLKTNAMLDLTSGKLANHSALWTQLENYDHCLNLVDDARKIGVEIIRYKSVRHRNNGGYNLAVLSCKAFNNNSPTQKQTWGVRIGVNGIQATRDFPRETLDFPKNTFSYDSRVKNMNWDRTAANS